jgi:predicted transcriptional regulator
MREKVTRDPQSEQNADDWAVLMLLVSGEDQRPWSIKEIIGESELDEVPAIDVINRLHRGGLIHRTQDDLIYPTRAAIYYEQIAEQLPE